MGSTDTTSSSGDDAASRLATLHRYFREHPTTGPTEGHATTVHPAAPLHLGTLDHITASVREVTDHTYATNPDAGPAPRAAAAVYDWCREHTEHAPEADRSRLAAIEYRHYLEHAIRAGDRSVIRKQRCPKCATFGLMWQDSMQRALCTNNRCTDRNGFSQTFTLARLAHAHVTTQETIQRVRAT